MFDRSWPRCALWLCLSILPLLTFFTLGKVDLVRGVLLGLALLFGLQGLIAEIIGIRANARGASFPRRLGQPLGFPVLWRKNIPAERISRVDHWGDARVRIFLASGEFLDLPLTNASKQKSFLRKVGIRAQRLAAVRPSETIESCRKGKAKANLKKAVE